jgi:hypothetical protein
MKPTNYSKTLQAVLQGAKFKAATGVNGILNTYQLEEKAGSLWLYKFKSGRYKEDTNFSVDKVMTRNDTLVCESSLVNKRLELVLNCSEDIELINE